MAIKIEVQIEQIGQFPSPNCECHIKEPFGFVPEAGCKDHDTKQFLEFVDRIYNMAVKNESIDNV